MCVLLFYTRKIKTKRWAGKQRGRALHRPIPESQLGFQTQECTWTSWIHSGGREGTMILGVSEEE